MRSRPSGIGLGGQHGGDTAAHLVEVGLGQPEPARPSGPAGEVPGEREGAPVDHLEVSKTPSPTVSPWSNTETRAVVRRPCSRAVDPDPHRRVLRCRGARRRTASSRAAFSSVSAHSPSRVGAPGDAGAGAEAQQVRRVDPERADADGQLGGAAVGVDPADRAAVEAAGRRLQLVDDPQRAATWARR